MRRALLAAAAALGLAGCGTPSADLFVVHRTGSVPGARATFLFDDGGEVRCNGGSARVVPSGDLIDARDVNRVLAKSASKALRLPAKPGSITQFAVTFESGTIHFADNSAVPPALRFSTDDDDKRVDVAKGIAELQGLVRRTAKGACGLQR